MDELIELNNIVKVYPPNVLAVDDVSVTFTAPSTPGIYTTTLRVASNDPDQPTIDVSVTLTVTAACIPVSGADFTFAPALPSPGQTVTFTGTVAQGSTPITYTWDFDDSSPVQTGNPITHIFGTDNTYSVQMTAANSCPSQDTASHDVTVSEQPTHLIYLPLMLRNYESPVPNRPDLIVTNISVDGPVNAGQPVTVRVTVRNQGDQPVTLGNNFYVDLYVDRQPARLLPGNIAWGVQGAWFGVGDSVELTASYTFVAGTHQLYAQADTDNSVAERLEGNNTLGPVSVNAGGTTPDDGLPTPTPLPEADIPRPTPTPMP